MLCVIGVCFEHATIESGVHSCGWRCVDQEVEEVTRGGLMAMGRG